MLKRLGLKSEGSFDAMNPMYKFRFHSGYIFQRRKPMCREAKREMSGWMLGILVLLSFATLVSCNVLQPTPPPPPSVDDVTMTRSIDQKSKQPTDPTTTFKSTDPAICAVVKASNLVDGSTLEAKWYYNNVEVPEVRNSTVITGSGGSGYFSFSIGHHEQEPFWIGDWKVEVYLDDELVKTVAFQVQK
jgi:hypothetical protein